jgi:hypothetical protein
MSKTMPWFRAYTEMVDDEKLRLLAFEDRWHFVALLCLKGQGLLDEGGPLLMRKVAVKLGLSVREVEEVARRLAEVELIDKTTLQPLAWDARQMKSDSSAERVKAFRERKKQAGQSGGKTQEIGCNDDGNAQRNVTVTAQDTDTDTDKEDSYESLSPGFPDDDAGEPENQSEAADQADQPATKQSLPACPHLELLDIFAEQLPELPQPKPELWEGQRAKNLSARWKWCLTAKKRSGARYATTKAEALDFFRRYFGYVGKSDFLTGRDGRWSGCDLAWLVKADNFAKVLQGNYENRQEAA